VPCSGILCDPADGGKEVIDVAGAALGEEPPDTHAAVHEGLRPPTDPRRDASGPGLLRVAATVPLNGLAAAQLVDLLGDGGGRSLLVTGAPGAVGGYVVSLA
jgi:hypothetical protein